MLDANSRELGDLDIEQVCGRIAKRRNEYYDRRIAKFRTAAGQKAALAMIRAAEQGGLETEIEDAAETVLAASGETAHVPEELMADMVHAGVLQRIAAEHRYDCPIPSVKGGNRPMFGNARTRTAFGTVPFIVTVAFAAGTDPAATPSGVVAYQNGLLFTGAAFESGSLYVQDGMFVEAVDEPDLVIDLDGAYVVPPFGEAHNHNVELIFSHPDWLDATLNRYLQAGVFYIQNPNALPHNRQALADRVGNAGTPDVTFAHGGFTGPGGHPVSVVQRNIARGIWTNADGEGAFLFSVEDEPALNAAWSALLANPPDFIKVYLLYSEAYSAHLNDPETAGWRGLDPTLVPEVVRLANEAGFRVAAHVESAADFHEAVEAGVDQVAHMPGFRGDPTRTLHDPSAYLISEADALTAARKGIVVVTTLASFAEYAAGEDHALRTAVDRLNRANLRVLTTNGVDVAIGSDSYGGVSVAEATYLSILGVLSPAALLDSWSYTTPRAIFPERRIGRLAPDHEASFLVLDGDPLKDFGNVKEIRRAVKQGQTIMIE